MGHPNSKKHKANHGGYIDKPTKKEVQANLNLWASLGIKKDQEEVVDLELDILFGSPGKGTSRIGQQLSLF